MTYIVMTGSGMGLGGWFGLWLEDRMVGWYTYFLWFIMYSFVEFTHCIIAFTP